ncbi:MAG: hypothetical protein EOS50_11275 [Mesorhizobium sp.]|nr:MAG: hypothetical protein EOS50_11275 [Mesorhizobium sp.]
MFQVAMEKGMHGIRDSVWPPEVNATGESCAHERVGPEPASRARQKQAEAQPGLAPGFAEIQVRPSREWRSPRTGAERT